MGIILLAIVWIVCGVVAYGIAYGYFSREFDLGMDKEDRMFAMGWAVGGPITMIMGYFLSGKVKHGFRYI